MDLFSSVKEAYEARDKRNKELYNSYYNSIQTMEDLLTFPLYHCIDDGNEFCNHEARKAYRDKMQELFFNKQTISKELIDAYQAPHALGR